ncbi:MAG: dTMP kinase [Pseudomonadota bacterium]
MSHKGLFITLEGVEGAGKSTLLDVIANLLHGAGKNVLITREPGGTKTGEQLREILLEQTNTQITSDTELMIMFAARSQHISEVIRPALAQGKIVLCDRFTDASYAYQGAGRGIDADRISTLEEWVQAGLKPDLTLLFDIDVELGLRRAGRRGDADRFEQEQIDFFERVRHCYLQRAKAEPNRFKLINAAESLDNVKQQISHILNQADLC